MSDSPLIHLGSLMRSSEDAHAEGELSHLNYEQGGQPLTLTFTEPAPYEVSVNALSGNEMYLQGSFEPTITMDCARCLREVEVPLELDLGTLLRYDPAAEAPYLEEAETGEEVLVFGDPTLDLSGYLAEMTLMSAPLSVVHDPECKGLCQVCGHDLNDGPCEHMAGVPVEEIDDDLGIPQSSGHAKQTPFAGLRDLQLPDE
ncbi:YceD family protein [Deinococcus arenicola]|uniref:YceD family protein n=1 Tax=Deinococcus arenicola TaxID=2994950 RepID=A0ABU4DT63_9DEIO|nr:YceD family protein [Deinococcus sp. ZS9-10]MDV6375615.1 YceD family protein [Deinococcus sp. ZS9-10]